MAYTPGRFVIASTDAAGARDMIALTQQVKMMREKLELVGHRPALLLVVVADGEHQDAHDLLMATLDGPKAPEPGDVLDGRPIEPYTASDATAEDFAEWHAYACELEAGIESLRHLARTIIDALDAEKTPDYEDGHDRALHAALAMTGRQPIVVDGVSTPLDKLPLNVDQVSALGQQQQDGDHA